jgi:hypothetical protein
LNKIRLGDIQKIAGFIRAQPLLILGLVKDAENGFAARILFPL